MSIEEHGDFFIQRRTLTDPSGEDHQIFDVGHIIEIDGKRIRKLIADRGFWNREAALNWIKSQTE